MVDKAKLRELEKRIDEVLYYVWDPIGVSDVPSARAEYSSYTMILLKYVLKDDLMSITHHLNKIEADYMGLTPKREHNEMIAQRLLDYKDAVEEGLK